MEEEQGGGKMKCCSRCSRIAGSSISTLPASYININTNIKMQEIYINTNLFKMMTDMRENFPQAPFEI